MAVLQKIRVKFGLAISIIIALALLSFIIDPSTLESAVNSMSSKYDVGQINGKKISYTDFQADIDRYTTINQIATGSSVQDEKTQKQIRDGAWQEAVDRYMFIKQAKAAGITVGEDEMLDQTTGNNISPILAQNPAFADENGLFSVDNLKSFLHNISEDESGRMKIYWNFLQNSVYTGRFYAKYLALYTGGSYLDKLSEDALVAENNTTMNLSYVMLPYDYNDTTVAVSNAEIKEYYNTHKKNYKQQASRDMEYVVFEVVPSDKDIADTRAEMDAALAEFATTDNMKTFLLKSNSERPLSAYWYKPGDLKSVSADIDRFVFSGESGISPVFTDKNTFRSARVMAEAMVPDSVYVKHILLQGAGAARQADSLLAVLKGAGADFSAAAAVHSVDQNSMDGGELGNIGWLTQNYMIPGFESVITAEVNKPYVLTTKYGTHIVCVTKRTKPVAKKQVAILERTALAGKDTYNTYYAQANRFSSIAGGSYDGYLRAVDSVKVYSHKMNRITEATSSFGAIENAKEITRWVFDAKAGKASNIITVNQKFFVVAAVTAIHKEGYTPLAEVSSTIKTTLFNRKLHDKTRAEVAEKIAGMTELSQVAAAFDATVQTAEDVAFASTAEPVVDPALAGAAYAAADGVVAGPVAGRSAVYVFQVQSRQTGSFFTVDDARNMMSQKAQYATRMIVPVMMDITGVKDNRARFY
ncbi:MAG: SurA N-terminal domain-containing protein [Bacteroidales bacterium]|nr:SurA N-terminal domain-containing protein [Bacteroidales bacterium]